MAFGLETRDQVKWAQKCELRLVLRAPLRVSTALQDRRPWFTRSPFFVCLIVFSLALLLSSCTKQFTPTNAENSPPKTFITAFPYRDSVQSASFNPQSSLLEVKWWASDPHGLVIGYLISLGDRSIPVAQKIWTFTTKDDSTFFLPLYQKDTTYTFSVAGIDDSFKRPLKEGDTVAFAALGMSVDQQPASIKFPITNSPPSVAFVMNGPPYVTRLDIPDTTFTVVSFGWQGADVDGNNTIISYFIALNDTSAQSWVQLPAQANFVTLEGRLSEASGGTGISTVTCDVYPNTYPALSQSPLPVRLPNMKLNANNIFYMKVEDVAGAFSRVIRMPDTTHTWFVKKPRGSVLIINDYGVQDQSTKYYSRFFDSLAHGQFDLWDIKTGSNYPKKGNLVQPYIVPTFYETLKLYKYVFWYSYDEQDFDIAQSAVRNFRRNAGGKFFMTFSVPSSYSSGLDINREISDFTDAIDSLTGTILTDSLSSSPITSTGFVKSGTTVLPVSLIDSTIYPILIRDSFQSNATDGGKVVANLRAIYPTFGATVIYNMQPYGVDNRQPILGVMSGDRSAFVLAVPLYRFNGNSTTQTNTRAYQLIYKVFKDFGAF